MRSALVSLALVLAVAGPGVGQVAGPPDTLTIASGPLRLRALLWRPASPGPFPAVLFNHGSYGSRDAQLMNEPAVLGPLFARHGYVFLLLYRRGVGLSSMQGPPDGDLMDQGLAAKGPAERNRVQLELMETEEQQEAIAAMTVLRARPDVDPSRLVVVGHSFGGALSLLLAARDSTIRAAVVFGAAAASWRRSPALRARLVAAARSIRAPILFLHAANDYSIAPGRALAAARRKLGRPYGLEIYPAFGRTPRDGHNFLYRHPATWEADVFRFLAEALHR